ncbi:GNAT family N-acetyltransferase [Streptomyces gamaensis]|uniref:GNAT family N-acetyltransferase n=1 Tax=Streptomyces gamaensis TaxID=1763542 RepID=A0ABW0Z423_9ACTN
MDRDAVLELFDAQMRRGARPDGPGARVEHVGGVVRQVGGEGGGAGSAVLWSGLDAGTADMAITAQVEYFASRGRDVEWKLYGHDRPADLGARLRAAGFVPGDEETLMVAETGGAAADAAPPDGVVLRDVTDAAGVELMVAVHEQAFGTGTAKRFRQRCLAQLGCGESPLTAVVALADGLPVSAARLEVVPGTDFAGLWSGGTVPAWRGRGLYRSLVAHRARIAARRGCRYLQVDASTQSRPILERLGFVALTTTTPYVLRP